MSKFTFSYSMGDNAIEQATNAVAKRVATLNSDVQKIAVSILAAFRSSGDKPTAAKRANALHAALGKGMRANSLTKWFECFGPFVWNKETKGLVIGLTSVHPFKDHTSIDLELAKGKQWYEAEPQEEYKPLADWSKMLKGLIERARVDLEKQGEKSKVDKGQLEVLERMIAAKAVA